MIAQKRYKKYISAALLLLYVFIVTPVQAWHQHDDVVDAPLTHSKQLSISKSLGYAGEHNCKICAHHYSAYAAGTSILVDTPITIISLLDIFFEAFLRSIAHMNVSDRAPPSVA